MKLILILLSFIIGIQAFVSNLERRRQAEACETDTNVKSELISDINDGKFTDDENLKNYLFCVGKISGVISESGELQIKVLEYMLSRSGYEQATVNKIISECGKQKEVPQETIYQFMKCAYNAQKDD